MNPIPRLLRSLWLSLLLLLPSAQLAAAPVDVTPFAAERDVQDIAISPTGEFLAASMPFGGRPENGLVVFRRSDMKPVTRLHFRAGTQVHRLWWANPTRVLIELADTFGTRDYPSPTGELFAVDADGGRQELLVGWRVQVDNTATRIRTKKEEDVFAFMVDALPGDDDHVLIKVQPFSRDPYNRVERLNVYSGRRKPVARAPVTYADFQTDASSEVRFAYGSTADNYSQLYYRGSAEQEWQLVNHERDSGRVEVPLGFSADNRTAYLHVSHATGPSSIVAMDVASGERKELVRDPLLDPQPIYRTGCGGCSVPVGAHFLGDKPKSVFFDEASADARLHRGLAEAFQGNRVRIPSATNDGRLQLLEVQSDVDPGSFYLFDTVEKKASFLLARGEKIDPTRMVPMRPIRLKARDGLELHGYLTLPRDGEGRKLPMVVMPHGGPFGQFDDWAFNADTQLLAQAGYAVLQVNFRGSGNRGKGFRLAGAREWGGKMQDDVTDATRWAVAQGFADPARVCLYGASYGAYAALMGVAKEPELYRCAAGYVGVYDLPKMQAEDSRTSKSMRTWSKEWVGDDTDALARVSPNRLAANIKVPVLLAAGGEDMVAPIEHSRLMERALKQAGVPVDTLYYPDEGHGFYTFEHRQAFYTRLLGFLAKHIGGQVAGGEAAK